MQQKQKLAKRCCNSIAYSQDRRFASAERTARFLRYVVEKGLAGAASQIKEIVIATDLYKRSSDYDPKIDSIVRVEATRLRTKLSSYYQEEGSRDPIVITIPKGSYMPQFERQVSERFPEETNSESVPEEVKATNVIDKPRWRGFTVLVPLVTLAAFCSMAMWLGHSQ